MAKKIESKVNEDQLFSYHVMKWGSVLLTTIMMINVISNIEDTIMKIIMLIGLVIMIKQYWTVLHQYELSYHILYKKKD